MIQQAKNVKPSDTVCGRAEVQEMLRPFPPVPTLKYFLVICNGARIKQVQRIHCNFPSGTILWPLKEVGEAWVTKVGRKRKNLAKKE